MMKIKNWKRPLIFLSLVTLSACSPINQKEIKNSGKDYKIVIEAGSSGTRLFLYQITTDKVRTVTLLDEKSFDLTASNPPKDEDGINNYVDPSNIALQNSVVPEVIDQLLSYIKKSRLTQLNIPAGDVEVSLLATAGMRTAEQNNQYCVGCNGPYTHEQIAAFYQIIKDGIKAQGFTTGDVRTSDGNSEEGVWTWISVNDLNGLFTSNVKAVGVIQVGGSSTQISYLSNKTDGKNIYTINLNGKSYSIFNRTYLGLGMDDARKAIRQTQNPRSGKVDGGTICFAKGLPYRFDRGDVLNSKTTLKLTKNGEYQFAACESAYNQSVIKPLMKKNGNPNILSDSVGDFVGIGGIYWAIPGGVNENTAAQMINKLTQSCLNYENFMPKIEADQFIQAECANNTYVRTLLYGSNGLFNGITASRFVKTIPVKKKGITQISWTRGYLLSKYSQ